MTERALTQFVKKLEQNDQKCVYFYFLVFFTLLQLYETGKKYDLRKGGGGGGNYIIFDVKYRPLL